VLLIVAAGGVAAYGSLHGRGTRPLPKNAELAIVSPFPGPLVGPPPTASMYDISSVDQSGRLHWLVPCPYSFCGIPESADWASDGQRLAISVSSVVNTSNDGLHVVDLRTGRARQLVRRGQYAEYDWLDIDWAPDGRRLAYATNNSQIAIINTDGSGHRILETGSDYGSKHAPSWSPDGHWIAYASVQDGESSVYVSRADGSEDRLLARHAAAPAWSPDGTRIAFRASDGIEFISPNGRLLSPRGSIQAGTPVGISGTPGWSPDGMKIAISNPRSGTWIMNADGTGLRRLTRYADDRPMRSEPQAPRPAWRPRP
jgi:Tol biopolymer transport system component